MNVTRQLEVERKYEVPNDAVVPYLGGLHRDGQPPLPADGESHTVILEAVYYDTDRFDLAAHRITLRRRTGGKDAGWHIKFPADGARTEFHVPPGPDTTMPREVRNLVRVHIRERHLHPVAELRTTRRITVLADQAGEPAVELSDDTVTARNLTNGKLHRWREWEVELLNPRGSAKSQEKTLDAVESRLREAGATPSGSASKIARVLDLPAQRPPEPGKEGSVRRVLTTAFRTLADRLKDMDPKVRHDEDDAVHQMRVAARSLRSLMQTYGPLLQPGPTDKLEAQLQLLGRLLSTARDAEVMRDEVADRARAQDGLIDAHVVKRLQDTKQAEYDDAHEALLRELESAEYFAILDALDSYVAELPLADQAEKSQARKKLYKCAAKDVERVLKSARLADQQEDEEHRIELLHKARKRAKRLRYAMENVSEPSGFSFGGKLETRVKAAHKVQKILGEHRDSVMFQQYVRDTAPRAHLAGEDTFGYGLLYAAETPRQQAALAAYEKQLAALKG